MLDSAGTGDWHVGHAPDKRAQAEARRRGVDISKLRARQLSPDDFYDFDLILAADETNLRDARAIRPADATADLRLMLDLPPGRTGIGRAACRARGCKTGEISVDSVSLKKKNKTS